MKLSVVIITYNQVSFIRQCMESVLAQQFDASWEIVVADDASSDGTAQILGDYAQRHPHLIQLVTATANQGLVGNLRRALAVARGEYIAYLDGDDYWTDPRKLARQVAILDAHPEAVLSFHASRILIDHHPGGLLTPPGKRQCYYARDLVWSNFIPAPTMIYRRAALPPMPEVPAAPWAAAWDWYCHLLATRRAPALYLDECLSAYRVHSRGFWSSQSLSQRLRVQLAVLARAGPLLPAATRVRSYASRLRIRLQLQKAQLCEWWHEMRAPPSNRDAASAAGNPCQPRPSPPRQSAAKPSDHIPR